jgi:tight adherence protein C
MGQKTLIWLVLSLAAAAATAVSAVLFLVPDQLSGAALRGYRATRRHQAMQRSTALRLAWPFIRLCAHYAALLPLPQWKQRQSDLLRTAGEPWGLSSDELLGLIIAGTVGGALGGLLIAMLLDTGNGLVIVGAFLGFFLPTLWLNELAQKRLHSINRALPQALDLIVLSMGAGLDFIGAVRHIVEQWSDKRDPLCEELTRFLYELSLGKTRREALADLAQRAPTELVKSFVNNALQAERRGTPLVETLRIQADAARSKRFQTAERVAGRAGVVILVPLMFIFGATVLVMFGSLLVKGFRGDIF